MALYEIPINGLLRVNADTPEEAILLSFNWRIYIAALTRDGYFKEQSVQGISLRPCGVKPDDLRPVQP